MAKRRRRRHVQLGLPAQAHVKLGVKHAIGAMHTFVGAEKASSCRAALDAFTAGQQKLGMLVAHMDAAEGEVTRELRKALPKIMSKANAVRGMIAARCFR